MLLSLLLLLLFTIQSVWYVRNLKTYDLQNVIIWPDDFNALNYLTKKEGDKRKALIICQRNYSLESSSASLGWLSSPPVPMRKGPSFSIRQIEIHKLRVRAGGVFACWRLVHAASRLFVGVPVLVVVVFNARYGQWALRGDRISLIEKCVHGLLK